MARGKRRRAGGVLAVLVTLVTSAAFAHGGDALRFRGDANYPPFEYLDERGKPSGYNVDIARAVAAALDLSITIDLGPWAEVRRQLEVGEIDALLGMYQTPQREGAVDFSVPHLVVSYAVFVREGSPIRSVEDAAGTTIIVQESDLGHDYVVERGLTTDIVLRTDWADVLRTLANGGGDCAIVSRLQGMRLIDDLGLEGLRPVGGPIVQKRYCFAVREGNRALLSALNEGLSIIKTTGVYDEIYERWFGAYDEPETTLVDALRYTMWVLAPLVALAALFFAWSWSLRRQVRRRTADLEHELGERRRVEQEMLALERRLAQAHKMEAIGTLAGGIAHDFNNILVAIIGYVELVRDTLPPTGQNAQDLETVLKAARRAADLVQQILTFSRRRVEAKAAIDVGRIVTEALHLLRSTLPTTIEIRTEIADGPQHALADPSQIHQVLMNLGTNAYHAMRERGGTLTVRLLREDAELVLEVVDTGIGMAADVARRCFEPFFTTRAAGQGTGLGLSVVYGIVTDLGGQIAVETAPGMGTTFRIRLPRLEAPEAPVAPTKDDPARGVERILFVDDEESIAQLGGKLLGRLGYRVAAFTDARRALDHLREAPDAIDLLVTDQTMPGLTGDELLREVRGVRPDLRVILCTGYSDTVDEARALALGADAFLLKPFDHVTLATAVRRVLDQGTPR